MTIATIGIDLGKNSCSLAGLDGAGCGGAASSRYTRERLVAFLSGQTPCVVALEACCGAHHLGRVFAAQGHAVRLMSPEYVAALREGAEERRPRRRGDRRGGDAADHAVRGAEVRGAGRLADAASGPVAAGERPDTADEPVPANGPSSTRIAMLDRECVQSAPSSAPARRLATIPEAAERPGGDVERHQRGE